MNCFLQKYTTHQFTYVIYYLLQDKVKNPKFMKIQEVHQKLHTKQFLLLYGYYTGPVNSADSTDFTGPEKTHSSVLKHAT